MGLGVLPCPCMGKGSRKVRQCPSLFYVSIISMLCIARAGQQRLGVMPTIPCSDMSDTASVTSTQCALSDTSSNVGDEGPSTSAASAGGQTPEVQVDVASGIHDLVEGLTEKNASRGDRSEHNSFRKIFVYLFVRNRA